MYELHICDVIVTTTFTVIWRIGVVMLRPYPPVSCDKSIRPRNVNVLEIGLGGIYFLCLIAVLNSHSRAMAYCRRHNILIAIYRSFCQPYVQRMRIRDKEMKLLLNLLSGDLGA